VTGAGVVVGTGGAGVGLGALVGCGGASVAAGAVVVACEPNKDGETRKVKKYTY
jgi:hypothetical protein